MRMIRGIMHTRKHLFGTVGLLLLLLTLAGGAGAQTYSNNFDANTVGSLPSGWTNIGSATYKVVTAGNVSSPNALGETTYTDGDIALYTAASISGGMYAQISEVVSLSSTNSSNQALHFMTDAAGANGYMLNPLWGGNLYLYKKVSGSYSVIGSPIAISSPANGSRQTIKIFVLSGTISVKIWTAGTAEPTAVTGSWTDSTFTSGYCGVRTGISAGVPAVPADDFAFGPASSTAVALTGYTISGPSITNGSASCLPGKAATFTAATNATGQSPSSADTLTYSDNLSVTHGVFSPATQAVGTTGATSFNLTYTPPASYTGPVTLTATSTLGLIAGTRAVTVSSNNAVFDGDSLTASSYASSGNGTGTGTSYPGVTINILGSDWFGSNLGVPGETLDTMITNASANVDSLYNANCARNVLVVGGGTNNLGQSGDTPAQTYAKLQSYCAARRIAHPWKIIVHTLTPAAYTGAPAPYPANFDTLRDTYNALIRANWRQIADGLVDLGLDGRIGPDGVETNTIYFYADKTHRTDAGYAIDGQYAAAAILSSISGGTVPTGTKRRLQ